MTPARARQKAFTLVEVLAVLTIVSVLAMMALPMADLAITRQKERELKSALWEIRRAIDAYKQAVDQGAIARKTVSGYPPTLATLAEPVPRVKGSDGPALIRFLRRVPRDPFAAPGSDPAGTWGLRSFESPADRPLPGVDVYDVYSQSERIGSNGVALRQW